MTIGIVLVVFWAAPIAVFPPPHHNDINVETDQLSGEIGISFGLAFSRAKHNFYSLAFDIAEIAQSLHKCR
jgi:hypothetical protein